MNNLTRGGQATMNNVHMWTQITKILSATFLGVTFGVMLISCFFMLKRLELDAMWIYFAAKFQAGFMPLNHAFSFTWAGHHYHKTIGFVLNNPYFHAFIKDIWHDVFYSFLIGCVVATPITWAVNSYFMKQGKALSEDKFIRGMQLDSPRALETSLKKAKAQSDLSFDGHHLFRQDFELQHMLLDGTTGTGKTESFRKLLRWIQARGDKAIIYDKGCSFIGEFYDESKDHLLNPFDERCAHWDLWSDAHDDTDFENMAKALIPEHGESEPFWINAARGIFSSTASRMAEDKDRSITHFLEVVLRSKLENLSQYLEGTESAALVSDKIQKTAISIKSVLATYIKSLRFLEGLEKDNTGDQNKTFSITDWVTNEDEKGWLFMSSNARQHSSLRPLISMWLSIAATAILAMEKDRNRRIWVIIDEAPSLHRLPDLPETLAEVRNFGGCFVIGLQSVAQLRKVYGLNAANEMFDLLNTRLFFRSPSHEMAKITSHELGEEEVDVCKDNRSVGPNSIRDGVTFGFQTVTRPIVTTAEIMKLPDLSFYLRNPGDYPVCRFDMEFEAKETIARSFIKRKIKSNDNTQLVQALITQAMLGNLANLDKDEQSRLLAIQDESYDDKEKEQAEMIESVKKVNKKLAKMSGSDTGAEENKEQEFKPDAAKKEKTKPVKKDIKKTKVKNEISTVGTIGIPETMEELNIEIMDK